MSILNDLRHIVNGIGHSINTRPSNIIRTQKERAKLNYAYQRGIETGIERVRMYGPGADIGPLNVDWRTTITSFAELIRQDFKIICARAEGLYRAYPVARRAISLLDNNVVGSGIRPYPAIRYANGEQPKHVNDRLASDWERFVDSGIRSGTVKTSYYQSQSNELRTMATYGNVLFNIISSKKGSHIPFSFQILKPTRLDFSKDTLFDNIKTSEKKVIHGIEINAFGEPVAFHLENEGRFSADKMILSFIPIETEQYLGLSWLYPVLMAMNDHNQLFGDQLKISRMCTKLGVWTGREDKSALESVLNSGISDTSHRSYIELDSPGLFCSKDKPEPIQISNAIKENFKPLVDMIMGYIAMGMGFSYQAFTTDLNGANYSSGRLNSIGDNRGYTCLFKKFITYNESIKWAKFVEWEVLTGRLIEFGVTPSVYYSDPWYYNQALWLPMDYQEWVDPLNDMQALILSYKTGQITFKELCARTGKNMTTQLKELKEERDALIDAGLTHLLPENLSSSLKGSTSQNKTVEENENENK
ncbi:MAG: phage portal protein [Clostridiaceae bacterium]|nr:phage portal protein [Clostridiaceae bacterium]